MTNTKKTKSPKRFGYLLQEIFIVVIGVLIAISLNNLKESISNDNYVEKTLNVINNEIQDSRTEVDTILKIHYKMAETLEELAREENDQKLGEMIVELGGFQKATIKNVSLRFFIANKAELVDFKVISQLLDIESRTEILTAKIERLADFVYENLNNTSVESKQTFTFLLYDIIESEESLLSSYDDFINQNKDVLGQ
jgi:hypothetical protein